MARFRARAHVPIIVLAAVGLSFYSIQRALDPGNVSHSQWKLKHVYGAPPVPAQAFMITLPFRQPNLNYTLSQLQSIMPSSGIRNVKVVHGNYKGQYGKCRWCQLGLSLAHLEVWRQMVSKNIPRAYVFEDDVVFHDHFNELFPKYWQQVPPDALIVWIGHSRTDVSFRCRMPGEDDRADGLEVMAGAGAPWTTHAYIITLEAAHLLAASMSALLEGKHTEPNNISHLKPNEIKIDYFLMSVYERHKEKHRWVKFSSTADTPAKFGSHSWVSRPECALFATKDPLEKPRLQCERDAPTGDGGEVPRQQGGRLLLEAAAAWGGQDARHVGVPVTGVGLAFQNMCKRRPAMLERWRWARA